MDYNHTTESKEQEKKNEKSQGKKHSFTISKIKFTIDEIRDDIEKMKMVHKYIFIIIIL